MPIQPSSPPLKSSLPFEKPCPAADSPLKGKNRSKQRNGMGKSGACAPWAGTWTPCPPCTRAMLFAQLFKSLGVVSLPFGKPCPAADSPLKGTNRSEQGGGTGIVRPIILPRPFEAGGSITINTSRRARLVHPDVLACRAAAVFPLASVLPDFDFRSR